MNRQTPQPERPAMIQTMFEVEWWTTEQRGAYQFELVQQRTFGSAREAHSFARTLDPACDPKAFKLTCRPTTGWYREPLVVDEPDRDALLDAAHTVRDRLNNPTGDPDGR